MFEQKTLEAAPLLIDFSKAFDSIHKRKMYQILLAYGQPRETVAAMMMIYKNTKVKVRLPDGDTDIVAGVLQGGHALAPYLFIICLNKVLRTLTDLMKENCLTLKKARSWRYPIGTIKNVDYGNDIALLTDTPARAKSLLHWPPCERR